MLGMNETKRETHYQITQLTHVALKMSSRAKRALKGTIKCPELISACPRYYLGRRSWSFEN